MLPEHSQHILAKARSGRVYKPPAPPEEDEKVVDEEEEHKEVRQGFTVKKWMKLSRHLEEPEPEYLAKRRKGLPSQYTQPTPMRETKVKKTDAEGNVNVYKVLVPEGQAVEGEVQPTEAIADAAIPAPGTVVEGVGVVNAEGVVVSNDLLHQTPPRRRPAPLGKKKKNRGPGRGKKKVLFAEGVTSEQGTPITNTGSDLLTVPGIKPEGSVEPSEGGDTPMPDAGDEDEGSGEDGSDDEDQEDQGAAAPSPSPISVLPAATTQAQAADDSHVEDTKTDVAGTIQIPEAVAPVEAPPVGPQETSEPEAGTDAAEGIALPAPVEPQPKDEPKDEPNDEPRRDVSSSPDLPLSAAPHSRQNSISQANSLPSQEQSAPETAPTEESSEQNVVDQPTSTTKPEELPTEPPQGSDAEPDLLGSLERRLEQDSESMETT